MSLKVLIVEDMATYRTIIARSMAEISGVEVVGKVSNGKKALDFLDSNEVDFITLDVEMPIMDGLSTLKELKKRRINVPVVMLSGLSEQAAQLTIQCLELGAIDFVLKPQTASFVENQNQLIQHLKSIIANVKRKPLFAKRPLRSSRTSSTTSTSSTPTTAARPLRRKPLKPKATSALKSVRKPKMGMVRPKVLLIGVSTGGPKALAEVFENLKGPLNFPVLIVQHMPPKFTKSLADSLNRKGTIPVVEAVDGDVLENNKAYIAPGGFHMFLEKEEDFGLILAMNQEPPVNSCRPSVDVLFKSAISYFKAGEIATLIMTGMGRDGADGAEALHNAGNHIAIQSEDTCTIFGMPKAVEDLGIQDEVIDLQDIAPWISKLGRRY